MEANEWEDRIFGDVHEPVNRTMAYIDPERLVQKLWTNGLKSPDYGYALSFWSWVVAFSWIECTRPISDCISFSIFTGLEECSTDTVGTGVSIDRVRSFGLGERQYWGRADLVDECLNEYNCPSSSMNLLGSPLQCSLFSGCAILVKYGMNRW